VPKRGTDGDHNTHTQTNKHTHTHTHTHTHANKHTHTPTSYDRLNVECAKQLQHFVVVPRSCT